jgi:branched-subunit amino acid ABC-type transport system permease component
MDLVAFVLLLAVMLWRREGILGIRKRAEEG